MIRTRAGLPDTRRVLQTSAQSPRAQVCLRAFALTAAVALGCASPGEAELEIEGRLITHSGPVVDTLTTSLRIKGPLVRRELSGEGTLSDFLGRRVEILHRTSGASTVLDLDLNTYTRSAGAAPVCHPWNLFDLRWLGRAPGGQAGRLLQPDTGITLLGQEARALDLVFVTRRPGGSTIRFWIVHSLDSLFGAGTAVSLYCGKDAAKADSQLAAQLASQFGLNPESAAALSGMRLGFPLRIESFMDQDGSRLELSRFETVSVRHASLADSLFEVPASYTPAPGDQGK